MCMQSGVLVWSCILMIFHLIPLYGGYIEGPKLLLYAFKAFDLFQMYASIFPINCLVILYCDLIN